MRRAFVVLLVPLLLAAPAYAQRGYDSGEVEISVSFNLLVPAKGSDVQSQKEALEQGRKALYEIAANECTNLMATIASSCELRRLNVQSTSQRGMAQESAAQLSANAAYKITVKPKP